MKRVSASRRWTDFAVLCVLGMLAFALLGCTNGKPNDQEIRQKSEQATRDARQGAKQLADNAKVAAANAVEGVNAAAQGIKDGVNSGKAGDSGDKVDINSASTARLALLPSISITKAHDIVQGRPVSRCPLAGSARAADPGSIRPDRGQNHRPIGLADW